jgi:hypothetical protein
MALLTAIAHTEDAKRYSGPVTFYNQQLLPILGFSKWERLNNARSRLIASGWLIYECQGKRKPGVYWTMIPDEFAGVDDAPMDEGLYTLAGYKQGYNEGYKQGYNEGYRAGDNEGYNKGYKQGYPSNLSLNLSPKPKPTILVSSSDDTPRALSHHTKTRATDGYSERFEKFWQAFPAGRKKSKGLAWKSWPAAVKSVHKLPPDDKHADEDASEYLTRRAADYAKSTEGRGPHVKMPSTWLNQKCWTDDPAAWSLSDSNGKPKLTDAERRAASVATQADLAGGYDPYGT